MLRGFLFGILITIFSLIIFDYSLKAVEIDTGNILSNSTFGTGTTYNTDNWTVSSGTSGHSNMSAGGGNSPGGSVAAIGNTNIEQTVTLSDKTNMTVEEIQNGFSSTLSTDLWFWNQYDNTITLKQTITGSDGSTTTQQRVIEDDGCGYINCGSYTNYTDTHIQGSNTQTDFDIKVGVSNYNNRSGHYGPDIDDVQLKIQYTYINPLDEDTQEVIDDIDETIDDAIDDIDLEKEDFSWDNSWENEYYLEDEFTYEDEFTWGDDYYWEDEIVLEEEFYFEEEFDTGNFEEFDFTEFEEFEEITVEETFFEEEFNEPEYFEEIFEEEFEESFNDFIEETGMTEEFEQFLEDEGITAEEFFEEITEEEFSDELNEESFEEFEEPVEEIATNEESVPEVIESEEEGIETEATESEAEPELEEEQEVATNDTNEETTEQDESSGESTEETEVQAEDSEEQETVQSQGRDGVDTKDRITTDVRKVESKLKKNLKKIAKQLARIAKQNTQNLSKEDIFFRSNNTLNAYLKTNFYKSKEIYKDTNLELYNQVDLSIYTKDIYTEVTLASYSQNDPIEIHKQKMNKIIIKKNELQKELELLKEL